MTGDVDKNHGGEQRRNISQTYFLGKRAEVQRQDASYALQRAMPLLVHGRQRRHHPSHFCVRSIISSNTLRNWQPNKCCHPPSIQPKSSRHTQRLPFYYPTCKAKRAETHFSGLTSPWRSRTECSCSDSFFSPLLLLNSIW